MLKRVGEGHAVRDMKAIHNGKIVVVLQESGCVMFNLVWLILTFRRSVLSVFKTCDGLAVASTEIERFPPSSKAGPDGNFRSVSQPLWTWRRLHVLNDSSSTKVSTQTLVPNERLHFVLTLVRTYLL